MTGKGVNSRTRGSAVGVLLVGLAMIGCGRGGPGLAVASLPVARPDTGAAGPVATEVWRRDVGPSVFAAPRLEGGVVVVATGKGDVIALSPETGGRLWARGLGGPVRGFAVVGDRVYAATDRRGGKVAALALRDGRELWARQVGAVAYTPLVAGDVVVVAADSGTVTALDAATGAVRWSARLAGSIAAPPAAADGAVLVATRADTLYHLEPASGAILARTPLPARVSAPLVARGDVMLVPLYSGEVAGFDPAARVIRWRAEVGAPVLAAPVVARDGDAYVLTEEATIWRIPAGSGAAEGVVELGGAALGALTLAGEQLIVGRLDGALIGLALDGSVLWRTRLGDSIVAPPAADGRGVVTALRRGTIARVEVRR